MADVARGRTGGVVVGGASGGGDGSEPPKRPGASKPGRKHEKEQVELPKVTKQTLAAAVKKGNKTEESIAQLPVKGDLTLQWRSTNTKQGKYDLSNILYRIPLLAHVRGADNDEECTHCERGDGPLNACRSLSGFFQGACTNCAFGGHGNRCSQYTGVPPAPRGARISRVPSTAPSAASSQRTVTLSSKPRTLFNQGVSTSNAGQLERQAANLREQADANEARARSLRAGEHVRNWSNDSSFKGFSTSEEEFEGFPDDEDDEMEE